MKESPAQYLPHVARRLAAQARYTVSALDHYQAKIPNGFVDDANQLEKLAGEVEHVAQQVEASAGAVWTDPNVECEYRDWHHYVPDAGGYGVRMRLTLNTQERTANLFVEIDDQHGDTHADTGAAVPYAVACAMVGYTPDTLEG
jgi:hypothetical protein